MTNERDEAIEARAYQLWVESGYDHGHDEEHWRQAELEFDAAAPTEDVTEVEQRHADGVGALLPHDVGPAIFHRVPRPEPSR